VLVELAVGDPDTGQHARVDLSRRQAAILATVLAGVTAR
jgi:hypothetical protein